MARTLQLIEQDIRQLDAAVEAIAQDLHNAYRTYFDTLGQALRQQLILASYHLCTQGYPEQFLALSFSQRQAFQRDLRQQAQQAQTQLLAKLMPPRPMPPSDRPRSQNLLDALMQLSERSKESGEESDAPDFSTDPSPELLEQLEQSEQPEQLEPMASHRATTSPTHPSPEDPPLQVDDHRPITPYDLVRWRNALEEAIAAQLQEVSHTANRLLQKSGILSSSLPDPLLEVASKADMMADASTGPPNLLKLRIEAESEAEGTESAQLIVIHLRLSEIEFSDPSFSLKRATIRELSAKLNQIGRDFRRLQREKAIAEAESAWRSSWYDD